MINSLQLYIENVHDYQNCIGGCSSIRWNGSSSSSVSIWNFPRSLQKENTASWKTTPRTQSNIYELEQLASWLYSYRPTLLTRVQTTKNSFNCGAPGLSDLRIKFHLRLVYNIQPVLVFWSIQHNPSPSSFYTLHIFLLHTNIQNLFTLPFYPG